MKIEINKTSLKNLENFLADKLKKGCDRGSEVLKAATPIDTQRLYSTTRSGEILHHSPVIECKIIAGGLSVQGITREQDLTKDVDYAYYVEMKQHYIRNSLRPIGKAILHELEN